MKRESIRNISRVAALAVLGCGLLAMTSSARGDDDEQKCTNKTLLGDYGFSIEGVILAIPGVTLPPGAMLPLRGVALTHFDGQGNLTQVDHVVVNGAPPPEQWTYGSGPYSVNPDCTGTAVINTVGNPLSPVKLSFVVVREGTEIHTVVDANGVSSTGIKVGESER